MATLYGWQIQITKKAITMNPLISKFLQDRASIPLQALTIPHWEFNTTFLPHVCTDWEIRAYNYGSDSTYITQIELYYGLLKMPWGTHRITAALPLINSNGLYIGDSMRDVLYRIELLWQTAKTLPIGLVMENKHIEIMIDNESLFMDLWQKHNKAVMR
jgi:hypothetical protein